VSVCDHDSTECTCPFAWTEASDKVQNYGCLPEPYDIVAMRQIHNKIWACHSDNTKPCIGALNFMKEKGLPYKVIDHILVTESDNWGDYTK